MYEPKKGGQVEVQRPDDEAREKKADDEAAENRLLTVIMERSALDIGGCSTQR